MKAVLLPALMMLLTQTAFALNDCQSEALGILQKRDPKAYRLYTSLRTESQHEALLQITCRKILIQELSSFSQAVTLWSAYDNAGVVLVSGEALPRGGLPRQMLEPRAILNQVDPNDPITKIYLLGKSQAKTDFFILLDVMNAHTHELQTAVNLHPLLPGTANIGIRDRLVGVMNLVKLYLDRARTTHAATWKAINGDDRNTIIIQKLWAQAETTLKSSCRDVNFGLGVRDVGYLEQVYSLDNMRGLQTILDYVPDISADCRNTPRN